MSTQPLNQRLQRILDFLREQQYADLHSLAEAFEISPSTVRRALSELEAEGLIRRHHGGASIIEDDSPGGYDFITQDTRQAEEKHAIAQRIRAKIEPGMTIMLDGGTTTYSVARLLAGLRVIVITNSLPIAALFSEVSSAETIVTGGTVYNRLGVLFGPTCESTLAEMHADIAVLGGAGITEEGVWNSNALIVAYQKRMIRAADHTYFCLDGSKFGKRALALAAPFSPHLSVVTTGAPPPTIVRAAASNGTEIETVR